MSNLFSCLARTKQPSALRFCKKTKSESRFFFCTIPVGRSGAGHRGHMLHHVDPGQWNICLLRFPSQRHQSNRGLFPLALRCKIPSGLKTLWESQRRPTWSALNCSVRKTHGHNTWEGGGGCRSAQPGSSQTCQCLKMTPMAQLHAMCYTVCRLLLSWSSWLLFPGTALTHAATSYLHTLWPRNEFNTLLSAAPRDFPRCCINFLLI